MASTTLAEDKVRQIAGETFEHAPEQWRTPEISLRAATDFGGEDVVYVTAVFPDDLEHLSGAQRADLQIALGDRLRERGDHRLVYLSVLTRSDVQELKDLQSEIPSDAA